MYRYLCMYMYICRLNCDVTWLYKVKIKNKQNFSLVFDVLNLTSW